MSTVREAIEITAKLYRCQEAAKTLLGDEYAKKVQPYIDLIKDVAAENYKGEYIEALLEIADLPSFKYNEYMTVVLMAAYVELVEPS